MSRCRAWMIAGLLGIGLAPASSVTAFAQFAQQGPKLVGSGAAGPASLGSSVALSSDGNTAIVGGTNDNNKAGAAWVFTRNGGVWTQQGAKLVGGGAVGNAAQGWSVALSGDGNTAIVGGTNDNNKAGAAWVFTREGNVWTQQGPKLVGSGAAGAGWQGLSVAVSADGNTAIVGAPFDNKAAGAAWVFVRSGHVWTQQGPKLAGSGGIGAAQGWSVALSGDGNTAIVGGFNDNDAVGAVWVFVRNGNVWTQQGAKLVGSGASGVAQQGWSVASSGDGNTAIVGGFNDNNDAGAAWVFTRSGRSWTQQGPKLFGSGGAAGKVGQGTAVALSNDGSTAIVGATLDNNAVGAAWVFVRDGSAWSQLGSKLVGSDAAGGTAQGGSIALSRDGNTAIVGGTNDNDKAGAAWVFVRPNAATRR
jgi:hypothetical protein